MSGSLWADYQRVKIHTLLSQCTEAQQELFHQIFPNGVPTEKLVDAVALCERTIIKNNTKD
jgi:hypothetical protein